MTILSEINSSSNSDNNNNNNNKIHRNNSRYFNSKTVCFRRTILVQIVPSRDQHKRASCILDNSRLELNRLSYNVVYENDNDNENKATTSLMIHRNNKWRGLFNNNNHSLGKIFQPLTAKLSLKLMLSHMLSQSPNHSTVHQHIGAIERKERRRSSMLPSYHDKY